MNYRHGFHAGNFADVLKHAVLARILQHLRRKPAPFRVVDTHAGAGLYDLTAAPAARTGEWRDGVGRLYRTVLPPALAGFLEPYLLAVAAADPSGLIYPGSPVIARAMLRPVDRLVCVELHPQEAATLAAVLGGDRRVRVLGLDGWRAIESLLPPPERRGVILVDPPYEEDGDFDRLAAAVLAVHRRFATGIFVGWHPLKDRDEVARLHAMLAASGVRRLLTVAFAVRTPAPVGALTACGLVIVNPPWGLADELDAVLPDLAAHLASGPGAAAHVAWLVPE